MGRACAVEARCCCAEPVGRRGERRLWLEPSRPWRTASRSEESTSAPAVSGAQEGRLNDERPSSRHGDNELRERRRGALLLRGACEPPQRAAAVARAVAPVADGQQERGEHERAAVSGA